VNNPELWEELPVICVSDFSHRGLRLIHSRLLSFSRFPLFAGRETRRPIELLAFGMGPQQGIGTQLEKVTAIFKSKFSNHSFEPF
jgi:hypothetical protein